MIDVEQVVILCLLQKPSLMKELVLEEEHFSSEKNRIVLKLFKNQYKKLNTIDLHLFEYSTIELAKNQKNEIMQYLIDCLNEQLVIIGNFRIYQEQVFKNFISRRILHQIDKFKNQQISQEELLESIHELESKTLKPEDNRLGYNEIYNLISSKNKNIKFRFEKLSLASNIQEHDFVVIAARPGQGKTGFILNLIENLSDNYPCLYFNMEMSEKQVYQRLVAINSGISMKFHDNSKSEYQDNFIKLGCENIANKKIFCYSGTQTVKSIKYNIMQKSKEGHVLAFIDYVGLIRGDSKNSYERTTEIVKELRQVSLDYDCTIFLVAQINRNSEKEKDKRPKISDLKETGELEQSATTVLMLHNENYYKGINEETEDIQVIIGKNRNGTTGITTLKYNKKNQKFDNYKEK